MAGVTLKDGLIFGLMVAAKASTAWRKLFRSRDPDISSLDIQLYLVYDSTVGGCDYP